jgi:hypothetical protein
LRTFQKKIAHDFRAVGENSCRITGDFSPPPPDGRIFSRMTRAQSVAHWSGIPSLSHLWMAALLRLAAMLMQNAASFLGMRLSRLPGECHADATPQTLPPATSGQSEKANPAATPSQTIEALILRDRDLSRRSRKAKADAIVSKRAGGFTSARETSRTSADALLPRTGEALGARTGERSGSGGGPPHRLITAPSVPHRIARASRAVPASLPRSGEENLGRVIS